MLLVSAVVFAFVVYAYCFSWHDYCVLDQSRSSSVACIYEPQIKNWLGNEG